MDENFDNIEASTHTFLAVTNLNIDLQSMFDNVQVVSDCDFHRVKDESTGKTIISVNVITSPASSSASTSPTHVINMKYDNRIKGMDVKRQTKVKWFRNSLTIVLYFNARLLNCKICKNGMFQVTGCKSEEQLKECVIRLIGILRVYKVKIEARAPKIEALLVPVMRNIDFKLGFAVDREKLSTFINSNSNFRCLPETLLGYTGANIKIEIPGSILDMPIKKMTEDGKTEDGNTVSKWSEVTTMYSEYIATLPPKDQRRKLTRKRYTTILIFGSGKCIHSSINREYGRQAYLEFMEAMEKAKVVVEFNTSAATSDAISAATSAATFPGSA